MRRGGVVFTFGPPLRGGATGGGVLTEIGPVRLWWTVKVSYDMLAILVFKYWANLTNFFKVTSKFSKIQKYHSNPPPTIHS